MMANLATALLMHGRIETTQAKAKALRPFVEKVITMACKASAAKEAEQKLHYRREAIARVRSHEAVSKLFDERADEFKNRPGGYTRIYKLVPRLGDASEMALIELISADDEGYSKGKGKKPAVKKATKAPAAEKTEAKADAPEAEAKAEEKPKAAAKKAPAKKPADSKDAEAKKAPAKKPAAKKKAEEK